MRSLRIILGFLSVFVSLTIGYTPARAADLNPADYFNSRTGDEWTLDAVISLPDGKVLNATAHRKIEELVTKDGTTYFRARTWMEGLPNRSESTRLFRKDAKGAYSVSEADKDAKEIVEMQFPLKPGKKWKLDDKGQLSTAIVVGIETLTIAGKTYENCVHLRVEASDGKIEDSWEAPKIGTIKDNTVLPNGVKFALTLKEYKPGK
jgi:hypothetical protein